MKAKIGLITRMARWTAIVLVAAGVVGAAGMLLAHSNRDKWKAQQERQRAELFELSRSYINELAQSVTAVPIDQTFVNEIESRYFEEYEQGPMAVWAMATDGTFLFGVPRESFSRMNAIYDREITPRLEEGVFFDRQSFFLGHLDDAGETLVLFDDRWDSEGGDSISDEEGMALWQQLDLHYGRSDGSFVLSAPLKTSAGSALGSLYLSRSAPVRQYYRSDGRLDVVLGAAGGIAGLAFLFLWLLIPTWVYVDARDKGVARAPLFAFLTAVSSVLGLIVYLIARPEDERLLVCPGCDGEVNGGAFCPHCGRDLSNSICQTCSYPLEPEWAFCPSCRTETRAVAEETSLEPPPSPSSGQEGPLPEAG